MGKKPGERLIERLRSECGLDVPDDAKVERTYAGHWQRSNGAWLWVIVWLRPNNLGLWQIGSQYTVTCLLKSKGFQVEWDGCDVHIDPAEEGKELRALLQSVARKPRRRPPVKKRPSMLWAGLKALA